MKINSNINITSQAKISKAKVKQEKSPDSVSINSRKDIMINYYPQDPYVGEPVPSSIPSSGVTQGPDNKRIDTSAEVKPGSDGNMIYSPETPEFVAVQAFATSDKTIRLMEKYLGRKINWSFGRDQIKLNPDRGVMANAYYQKQEGSLNFFHFIDKKTGETIHTGKSYDTVAHETGHALLDGMRPKFLGWNVETEALHEAFADCTSMISALQDENNIDKFLEQTGGKFSNRNIIAYTGEQFGVTVLGKPYIRNALEYFKYKNPYELPLFPTEAGGLTSESHSFCRVFTGAFYDIMGKTFEYYRGKGMNPKDAMVKMRDVCGKLLIKGIDNCPPSNASYKDLAKAMIDADRSTEGGKHKDILLDVFDDRWIYFKKDYKSNPAERMAGGDIYVNSTSPEGVMEFIDSNRNSLGIEKNVPLNVTGVRKNDDGSENIDVTYSVEVPLRGSDYGVFDGAVLDLFGGSTLSTDRGGRLTSLSSKPVDREEIANTQAGLKQLIKDGRIKFVDPSVKEVKTEDLFDNKGRPYMGYTTYDEGKMKIVRSPVIC